jgi:hypothetical protein
LLEGFGFPKAPADTTDTSGHWRVITDHAAVLIDARLTDSPVRLALMAEGLSNNAIA